MKTKYYKKSNKSTIDLKKKYDLDIYEDSIIASLNDEIMGYLEFVNEEVIEITNIYIKDNAFSYLFSKLRFINYLSKEMLVQKQIYLNYDDIFSKYFKIDKVNDNYKLKFLDEKLQRYLKIGNFQTGSKNNICDVIGVSVGHFDINEGDIHTGVTAVIPHKGNIFKEKLLAANYVYNGFGKSIGFVQMDELGTIETPILLTNTLNVGKVADGLIEYSLNMNQEIGRSTGTVNPIVLECNDGSLNDIRNRVLENSAVDIAIINAKEEFLQGGVGAGSGMTCHGFKGGIGSSSRIINLDGKDYTIGILVNSNFLGSTPKYLIMNNNFLGNRFLDARYELNDKGSIIIVIATDIPLCERQLKRLCKRAILGIGKTGSYVGNGSGDIVVGFSTANKIEHFPKLALGSIKLINDNYLDILFKATVDATEEAILNSLFYSKTVKGVRNNLAYSINEYLDVFDELLIENHLGVKDV